MALSMYQASVPVFISALTNLFEVLTIAENHAVSAKIDPLLLVNARWRSDAIPLFGQVQIICDVAKGSASKLANIANPAFPLNETSLHDLKLRVEKTNDFLRMIKPEQMDGNESMHISLRNGLGFDGQGYLLNFVLPKFYYHMAIACLNLRSVGVDVGKKDMLGFND